MMQHQHDSQVFACYMRTGVHVFGTCVTSMQEILSRYARLTLSVPACMEARWVAYVMSVGLQSCASQADGLETDCHSSKSQLTMRFCTRSESPLGHSNIALLILAVFDMICGYAGMCCPFCACSSVHASSTMFNSVR